uniref:threonine--tRNA ligase n=1 Tax=Arcella intermedia TaxID=1963864 RepID=A0A6B2LBG0_9EUKA
MALKPMNCPGHCLIFSQLSLSYKDLPLRLADFSALHRNESSGSLRGLTRVRKFSQDDAHIFCTEAQIPSVVDSCIKFLKDVYQVLGFDFSVALSTRPASFMGTVEMWDRAEGALSAALVNQKIPYTLKVGDGAFYGPKIDVMLRDALQRQHQCGTIQLDFQLPLRFDLAYTSPDGTKKTPVIIHRAILGSLERMLAVLIEDNCGKWPFWLSPRQAIICTISEDCTPFAQEVHRTLHQANFFVDLNTEGETIEKKIRDAQHQRYNYILVIGKKELSERKVNLRTRDNAVKGLVDVQQLLEDWKEQRDNYK